MAINASELLPASYACRVEEDGLFLWHAFLKLLPQYIHPPRPGKRLTFQVLKQGSTGLHFLDFDGVIYRVYGVPVQEENRD